MSVPAIIDELRQHYHGRAKSGDRSTEIDLASMLRDRTGLTDEQITDVIENDARLRLDTGLAVMLARYLEAIPGLPDKPVALDAAIEYALRWMVLQEGGTSQAVAALIREHPALEGPIRDAATLGEAVLAGADLSDLIASGDVPEFPRGFGPRLPTGRPRYVLRELLGKGSHGSVYLAVDRQLSEHGRPALVAIKVMADDDDPVARRRLIEEATKARRVDHPNVVRILDRGRSAAGEDYVVYEYVPGRDLETNFRTRAGPMPLREAASLVAGIARGVQAAHAAGLVHCDLKPANILLTSDAAGPIPKVTDFGVAVRHESPAAGGEADDGRRVGNLAFIAPEQFRMEPGAVAPAADIFALGGILYYLLTEVLPNGRTADQIAATHSPIGGRQASPSPREKRVEIDRDLDAICRRALGAIPQDRYASAESLANDLEAWLEHRPLMWNRPGPWWITRQFMRRQPMVVIVATLAAAAALLIGGIIGYNLGLSAADQEAAEPVRNPHTQQSSPDR